MAVHLQFLNNGYAMDIHRVHNATMRGRARTFTFVFTDIVGSSRQWEAEPKRMISDIEAHHRIVEKAVKAGGGQVFKSLGDGQAAVFDSARDAVFAAVETQKMLRKSLAHLEVRVGVHSGTAELVQGDYMGSAVNRVARITALACGGQVLVSGTTVNLVADELDPLDSRFVGEAVLAGHERPEQIFQISTAGLESDFPALTRVDPKHNLTALDRAFVGRVAEREDLNSRLASGAQRLITILGFGGMGKTTLARQCAWDSLGIFPDGVWWVDCEALGSREDLAAAALAATGVFPDPRSPERTLIETIGSGRCLLILDCFERIVALSGLIDSLLKSCPKLQVLVTSRLRLGLSWEFESELRGLSPRRGKVDADAIDLFREAAVRVMPQFQIVKENRKQVAQIVADLDFLPLALVITAGRLRHLTLDEIATSIRQSRLDLVSTGPGAEGRHASLRKVIGASLALLSPGLRTALFQLSVFEGGFFIPDASAVLGFPEVFEAVAELRDHSLLHADPHEKGMRYRELDSVREYIAETVDAEDLRDLRLRHARHYLRVAEDVHKLYAGGKWEKAARLLWLENANLRRAVSEAASQEEESVIADYALRLARPYVENGLIAEFEALAEKASSLSETRFSNVHLEILGLKGIVALRRGSPRQAEAHWELQANLCRQLKNPEGEAESVGDLINLAIDEENTDRVQSLKSRYLSLQPNFDDAKKLEHTILRARFESFLGNHDLAIEWASQVAGGLKDDAPVDWKFYASRTLAEIYRNAGHIGDSLEAGAQMVTLGLQGRFAHRVGLGLIQIAHSLIAAGRRSEAAEAVIALCAIPSSRVPAVTQITVKLQSELHDEIASKAKRAVPTDWTDLAREVVSLL